jgi:hypothetical protein
MTTGRTGAAHEVTIVAANPETLDGLQAYLSGAGIAARCARDLDACKKAASARTLAVVVFPDDFRWEEVVETLAELAEHHPRALPVLVTAHPQRCEELRTVEEVLIVPRPVWGWTILDAIRGRIDRREGDVRARRKGG